MRLPDLPPPEAFAHGTRARYVSGCRCAPCRASNVRRYHERRAAALAALADLTGPAPATSGPCPGLAGEACRTGSRLRADSQGGICHQCRARLVWDGLVDAGPVREHLQTLSRQGVGYKSVAAACDVGKTTLQDVMAGRKRLVRKSTPDRVLAVTAAAIADAALVDARPTWRLLDELLDPENGFTKAELARRLGYQNPALQIRRNRIRASTALRIARFYRDLMRGDERLERVYARAVA